MQHYFYPDQQSIEQLAQRKFPLDSELFDQVQSIIERVRQEGDCALRHYTRQFEQLELENIVVTEAEWSAAEEQLSSELKSALERAFNNISTFHQISEQPPEVVETEPGVFCWRQKYPLERVGLYVPGGNAPLFSTVLMLAVPAMLAGCEEIILATPAGKDGGIHPAILFSAQLAGVDTIIKCGGAQAIAALAYGTESITSVDKIFGPGNRYVTVAKQLVSLDACAIDMPAGPSEVMVVADGSSRASFVAADLLSQAEHGSDSHCVLLLCEANREKAQTLLSEIEFQISELMGAQEHLDNVVSSLRQATAIVVKSVSEALEVVSKYAPEHLVVQCEAAEQFAAQVRHAGSVFIGPWTPESVGDYASGTNHTLPTGGWARSYSSLSTDSFRKTMTFQKLNPEALAALGPTVITMAQGESMLYHAQAVQLRLEALKEI